MKISAPFNFQHKVHVQADPTAPNGFRGLPPGWAQQLEAAGISKEDAEANGDAIIDVLRFHMEAGGAPALPTQQQASLEARMAVTFINSDPADKSPSPLRPPPLAMLSCLHDPERLSRGYVCERVGGGKLNRHGTCMGVRVQ